MSDTAFALIILLAFFLFAGEPDLHDSIIEYLQRDCGNIEQTERVTNGTN